MQKAIHGSGEMYKGAGRKGKGATDAYATGGRASTQVGNFVWWFQLLLLLLFSSSCARLSEKTSSTLLDLVIVCSCCSLGSRCNSSPDIKKGRYKRLAWNILLAFLAVRSRTNNRAAMLMDNVRSEDSRVNHLEVRPPAWMSSKSAGGLWKKVITCKIQYITW